MMLLDLCRSASTESIAGSVKNPWTLLFQTTAHRYRFRAQQQHSSSSSSSSCHRIPHHLSTSSDQSLPKDTVTFERRGLHTTALESKQLERAEGDVGGSGLVDRLRFDDDSDWLVTGGSSGGSAAAVASGTALA